MDGGAIGLPDRVDLTANPRGIDDKKSTRCGSLYIVFDKADKGILDPGPAIGAVKLLAGFLQRLALFFDAWQLFADQIAGLDDRGAIALT